MGNLLVGLVGYKVSESIGLPDSYGMFCVIIGSLLFCTVACFLQEEGDLAS